MKFYLFNAIVFLILGSILFFLAYPYRPVPSDDLHYTELISGGALRALFPPERLVAFEIACPDTVRPKALGILFPPGKIIVGHDVVNQIYLFVGALFAYLVSAEQSFLVVSVFGLCLAAFFLLLLVRFILGNSFWAWVAAIIFLTSPYSVKYLYWANYSPLAAALMTASIYFAVIALRHQDQIRRRQFLILSGSMLGLLMHTTTAALPVMFYLTVVILFVRLPKRSIFSYLGSMLTPFIFLNLAVLTKNIIQGNSPIYKGTALYGIYLHTLYNILTMCSNLTCNRLGISPYGVFIPWKMLFHLQPLLFFLFLASLIICTIIIFNLILYHKKATGDKSFFNSSTQDKLRILIILTLVLVVTLITQDLLPTTQLARSYFHLLPLIILISISWPVIFFRKVILHGLSKRFVFIIGLLFCVSVIYFGIYDSIEIDKARKSLPRFLRRYADDSKLYLIQEDPHAQALRCWLRGWNPEVISAAEAGNIIFKRAPKSFIILGPRGAKTGRSIFSHGTLPDFFPEKYGLCLSPKMQQAYFPYYAFHKNFLFEEEVCQALFFRGMVKNNNDKDAMLLLLRIE